MNEIVARIEKDLDNIGQSSQLSESELSYFPEILRNLHSYKIFGQDLLAIPTNVLISGEDEEHQKPFSFLSVKEQLNIFESEFRELVPEKIIPFGYIHGASEIVLLDTEKDSVHVFHVSDVCDLEWLKYKLENGKGSFNEFLKNITLQTVSCFMNPNDYSQAVLIEIRNGQLYYDYELIEYSEDVWAEYFRLCNSYLEKGFEIHYGPVKVKTELKK